MTRVKICGLRTQQTVDAAAEADWVGFVFFPPSPRAVTPEQAGALSTGGPLRVGLFVEPDDAALAATIGPARLDILQVHASAGRAAEIRTRFGLPVWHVVPVAVACDLPDRVSGIDGLLLDAKAPPGAVLPGGNARPFDWTVLRGWAAPLPWLLAGGLDPANVAEAIRISGAPAVDVSSGVESARGVKDAGLIRAFIAAAR